MAFWLRPLGLAALLLSLHIAAPAHAQSAPSPQAVGEIVALAANGDEASLMRAEAAARSSPGLDVLERADLRLSLAERLLLLGAGTAARAIAKDVAANLEGASGLQLGQTLRLQRRAGVLLVQAGAASDGARIMTAALASARSTLGADAPALRELLLDVAIARDAAGDREGAAAARAERTRLDRLEANLAAEEGTRGGVTPPSEANGSVFEIVRVLYATDRRRDGDARAEWFYGPDPGPLEFGEAEVSLPIVRSIGAAPRAFRLYRFEVRPDPARHVIVTGVKPLAGGRAAFLKQVADRVEGGARKEALVFIHGYNQTFGDAAARAAQLALDFEVDGPTILYSWPSRGNLLSYQEDAAVAEDAARAQALSTLLAEIARTPGIRAINVIAHSMGARPLLAALERMPAPSAGQAPLNELIFAAPDVGVDRFLAGALSVRPQAKRVTLYASARDRALEASRWFNGMTRAGERAFASREFEAIETTSATAGLLGHDDFVGPARDDARALLWVGLEPAQRCVLEPANGAWRLSATPKCDQSAFAAALILVRRLGSKAEALRVVDQELARLQAAKQSLRIEQWMQVRALLNAIAQ